MLASWRAGALSGARRALKVPKMIPLTPAEQKAQAANKGRDPYGLFKETMAAEAEWLPRKFDEESRDLARQQRADYSRAKMKEVCTQP